MAPFVVVVLHIVISFFNTNVLNLIFTICLMIILLLAIVAVICWLRTIFVVLKLPLVHKFLHTEINEIRLTYRVQQGELFVHNL